MRDQGRGIPRLLRWRVFGLLFAVCAAWALGLPRGTAPDETHQVVRSAAVVRGELAGRPTEVPFAEVTVPRGYVDVDTLCFIGEPHVPLPFPPQRLTQGCWSLSDDRDPAAIATPQHRGQPSYYLLAGLPSLWASPTVAMHLMRLVVAAACCVLLAWGLTALLRLPRPGLALVAAAAALTPTVLYFASMVNPIGLELAATFSLAACGLSLVQSTPHPDRWPVSPHAEPAGRSPALPDGTLVHQPVSPHAEPAGESPALPDGMLVHQMGVSLVVLTVTRGLSGLFAVLTLVALAALAGRAQVRDLLRRRAVQVWLAAGAGGVAASVAWTGFVRSRFVEPHWDGSGLGRALGDVGWWSREMVAVFGTTDVVPPLGLHLLWLAAVLWLGWQAWLRRAVASLAVAGALVGIAYLALIIPGQAFGVPQTGYWWQGRYVLPLVLVAVLVLGSGPRATRTEAEPPAATTGPSGPSGSTEPTGSTGSRGEASGHRTGRRPRALVGVAGLLVAGHLWAFGYAVRHYTVGYDGPLSPLEFGFDPVWSPPFMPPAAYLLVMAGGLGALTWLLARAARRPAAAAPLSPETTVASRTVERSHHPEPAL